MAAMTITLEYPVKLAEGELKSLKVRRPTLGDHLEADKGGGNDLDREARLFARITGTNQEDLQLLDMADYKALQELYSGFLKPSRKEKPSGA